MRYQSFNLGGRYSLWVYDWAGGGCLWSGVDGGGTVECS
jgi:hypothetical protein